MEDSLNRTLFWYLLLAAGALALAIYVRVRWPSAFGSSPDGEVDGAADAAEPEASPDPTAPPMNVG